MIKSGVYTICDKIKGMAYVGSSVDIFLRWNRHKRELKKGVHHNKHLQRAWDKYGEENFELSFSEPVPDINKLREREQCWVNIFTKMHNLRVLLYNSVLDVNGNFFNRKSPGYSEETRKKMSELMKGNKFAKGKSHSHSQEVRKRISDTLKRRGSHLKGSQHGCAKLMEVDVIEIRNKFKNGVSRVALGTEYNVSKLHINSIVSRRCWKHI